MAIRHFEEAIALDPRYALAYAGLADCYSILRVYGWTPPEHSRPRALEAVTQALALDPRLPEAHFSRALYTFYFERHWRSARRHFADALDLSPRTALFEAYFGIFLATEYEYLDARQRLDLALELDPHSSVVHFLAASAACLMGDAPAAARHASLALELQPESLGPRWPQTVALLMAGRHDEALAAAEQVVARTRAPIYLGVLGMVYGRAGRLATRGAAPFSIVATGRWLLDGWRGDPEIEGLLDRLHDGARPPLLPGFRQDRHPSG
jgi:Tfp pilus assembly protein PilF